MRSHIVLRIKSLVEVTWIHELNLHLWVVQFTCSGGVLSKIRDNWLQPLWSDDSEKWHLRALRLEWLKRLYTFDLEFRLRCTIKRDANPRGLRIECSSKQKRGLSSTSCENQKFWSLREVLILGATLWKLEVWVPYQKCWFIEMVRFEVDLYILITLTFNHYPLTLSHPQLKQTYPSSQGLLPFYPLLQASNLARDWVREESLVRQTSIQRLSTQFHHQAGWIYVRYSWSKAPSQLGIAQKLPTLVATPGCLLSPSISSGNTPHLKRLVLLTWE